MTVWRGVGVRMTLAGLRLKELLAAPLLPVFVSIASELKPEESQCNDHQHDHDHPRPVYPVQQLLHDILSA
jgi:hypothetical protein